MAKLRSPNYPSLTLEEALTRAKKVYDKEHTHPAAREVVAEALGYNGLNGASLAVIGTLVRYGLLEKEGKGDLKVSSDAVTALELDEGHPDRVKALERLAFASPLFVELRDKFGNELPSDINLKHYLIQQKSFLPKAAEDVIRIYRENLELVTEQQEPYDGGEVVKSGVKPPMQQQINQYERQQSPPVTPHTAQKGPSNVHEFSFPLSFQRDVKATITIFGEKLRRRDFESLKKKVASLLEDYEDEEPEPETRAAVWRNKDHDQPVTVTGDLGERDGKRFYSIEGSSSGVPEDELSFDESNHDE